MTTTEKLEQEIKRQKKMIESGMGSPEKNALPLDKETIDMCKKDVENMKIVYNFLQSGENVENASDEVIDAADEVSEISNKPNSFSDDIGRLFF